MEVNTFKKIIAETKSQYIYLQVKNGKRFIGTLEFLDDDLIKITKNDITFSVIRIEDVIALSSARNKDVKDE